MADGVDNNTADDSPIMSVLKEVFTSPLNIGLTLLCAYLLYKIIAGNRKKPPPSPTQNQLPRMKKRDFTLEQLREYDGKKKDGRLLMAVNNKVFDVSRGKRFYGPGGPYGVFAGRDASRGLATFSLSEEAIKDEFDDLSDLNTMQMESVREWEMQFTEKYDYIGKLLRPGEQPADYTDTEDEQSEDKKDEQSGDKKDEQPGDKKDEQPGDKKDEQPADKKDEQPGDKKDEQSDTKKEEDSGDKKDSSEKKSQ